MRALKKSIISRQVTAFTLVELLVTVAIIAILIALGSGMVQSSKRSTNLMQCGRNLSRIWQATMIYVQDNDGNLPSSAQGAVGPQYLNGQPTVVGSIAAQLHDYIDDSVWNDPDPIVLRYRLSNSSFGMTWQKWQGRVAWGNADQDICVYGRNDAENHRPYRQLEIHDLSKIGVLECVTDDTGQIPHGGRRNRLFSDGHVETINQ